MVLPSFSVWLPVLFLLLTEGQTTDEKTITLTGKGHKSLSSTENVSRLKLVSGSYQMDSGKTTYGPGTNFSLSVEYPSTHGSAILSFNTFEVDCNSDWLRINGLDYCGKQSGREICLTGYRLKIEFYSDNVTNSEYKGFDISVRIFDKNLCPCKIDRPNPTFCQFPSPVGQGQYCATEGDHPRGTFCNSDVDHDESCDGDVCVPKSKDNWLSENWVYVFLVILFCTLMVIVVSAKTICYHMKQTPEERPPESPFNLDNTNSLETANIPRNEQRPQPSCVPCPPEPMAYENPRNDSGVYDELDPRTTSTYVDRNQTASYLNPVYVGDESADGISPNDVMTNYETP